MHLNNTKIITVAVLGVMLAALIIALLVGGSSGSVARVDADSMIFSAEEGEITSVDIKSPTGNFSVERCEEELIRADGKEITDIVYRVYGNHSITLSQEKIKKLLNDFYRFHVLETVSETSEEADLKEYGFTGEQPLVNIHTNDGQMYTFVLGGISPDEKARYVKMSGDEKIYSMLKVKEESFLNDMNYYRDRRVGVLDGYTLLSFSVTDKGVRKMGIRYKNENDREVVTTDAITYVMVLPYNGAVNIERFGELMSNFDEVYAVDFIEDNPYNISQYGLDDYSALKVVIQDIEQNRHELTFGKADEKGNIYTMYGGCDFVFTTEPKMYNAVKELNAAEFIDKYTNIFNLEDVRNVTVTGTAKTYSLDINSSGAAKYEINDKEALDQGFKAVYQGIIGIKITGAAEEERKEKEVLDITFTFKDGSKKTSKFYEYDSRNYGAVATDGTYGLVSERFVDNLLEILEIFDEKPDMEP